MISVKKAWKIISDNFDDSKTGVLPILEVVGHVLAEDIISTDNLPRFDQSAMDGYALRANNTGENKICKFKIINSIFPGDKIDNLHVKDYECVEITTGAPMPLGADAVVPIEDVKYIDGAVKISRKINKFKNVRVRGEDIEKGKIVFKKGDLINHQMIGLFASLGIARVLVFLPPSVGVITTGDELQLPEKKIEKYHIRNSNIFAIESLLKSLGIIPLFKKTFPDKQGLLCGFFKKLTQQGRLRLKILPDIVIITGGVSVGGHDYVKEELEKFGVKKLLWRVAQKPGKPMYIGIKNHTLFFGLPGNPGAVFVCFYLYVLPVINRYMRKKKIFLPEVPAEIQNKVKNDSNRTIFLNAQYKNGKVKLLKKQGSHMMFSAAKANSLARLESGKSYRKGKKISIVKLPISNF